MNIHNLSIIFGYLIIATQLSCSEKAPDFKNKSLEKIELIAPLNVAPHLNFTEISKSSGINFIHRNGAVGDKLQPEAMIGGTAFFDYDNDGDPDLLAVSATNWADAFTEKGPTTVALYRNDGALKFTDVTQQLNLEFNGYGMGLAIGDYDGDGWKDIYITALGKNVLYHNEQGLGFKDTSHILDGVCANDGYSVATAFFDADGDGDLDLFVANYVNWDEDFDKSMPVEIVDNVFIYSTPQKFTGTQPCFYENLGENKFKEKAKKFGFHITSQNKPIGKSLGILPIDLNGDHKLDVLLANDTVKNLAFVNEGNGKFDEQAEKIGFAFNNEGKPTAGMGIDVAWLTKNLTMTVAIGNFGTEMSSIYRLDKENFVFSDVAPITGIGAETRISVTFGVLFVDLDLDGRPDYIQANGHVDPDLVKLIPSQIYRQSAQIFWNCEYNCKMPFKLLPKENVGDIYEPIVGRALVAADIDADGDLDLAISEVNGRLRLFQNNQDTKNHWIKFDLYQKNKNRFAIGSLIEIKVNGRWQKQLLMPSRSYLSQNPTTLIFGTGKDKIIQQVKITWPDGQIQWLNNIDTDQKLTITRQ